MELEQVAQQTETQSNESSVMYVHEDVATAAREQNLDTPAYSADTHSYERSTPSFWADRTLAVHAKWYHAWALGVGIVVSGAYNTWNTGLIAGLGSYVIAAVLTGLAYWILTCSLAEMSSVVPFSGGSYGFARVTMGKYAGLFVGLCESFEYVFVVAVNMLLLGLVCTATFETHEKYEPLWVLIAYVFSLAIHLAGGPVFWNFTFVLCLVDVLILIWFALGSWKFVDFKEHAPNPDPANEVTGYFIGGIDNFLKVLPISIWLYIGIEAVPLACEETDNKKKNIPKGMVWGMATIIALNFVTFMTCVSLPPGDDTPLLTASFPLLQGFNLMFGRPGYSTPALTLLYMPAVFASGFGLIFAYGRQMFAMSRSGFLPQFLSLTWKKRGTPWASLLTGSIGGFVVCMVARWAFDFVEASTVVYNAMLICALINYCFQLVSFIILRRRYGVLKREYTSPYGEVGAVFSMLVFILTFIALIGWGQLIWQAFLTAGVFISLGLIYYVVYARKHLCLSPEEQFAMFVIFAIDFNRLKRNDLKHATYQPEPHMKKSTSHSPRSPKLR